MAVDRNTQLQILEALHKVFPERLDSRKLERDGIEDASANIAYMEERGWADAKWAGSGGRRVALVKVTAAGIDFLSENRSGVRGVAAQGRAGGSPFGQDDQNQD